MYVSGNKIKTSFFWSTLSHYTVTDWVWGQHQLCLTKGRICCPKPLAEGNRSVWGSYKTAVVREVFVAHLHFSKLSCFIDLQKFLPLMFVSRLLCLSLILWRQIVETIRVFHLTGKTGRQHCHCWKARHRQAIL